ncbi:unnamed protein product [Gordionus sp. m RMFG-2023]
MIKELKQLLPGAHPRKILVDFEQAPINAFRAGYLRIGMESDKDATTSQIVGSSNLYKDCLVNEERRLIVNERIVNNVGTVEKKKQVN